MGVSGGGIAPWLARAASASRPDPASSPPTGASTTVVGGMGLEEDGSDMTTSSVVGGGAGLGLVKGLADRC